MNIEFASFLLHNAEDRNFSDINILETESYESLEYYFSKEKEDSDSDSELFIATDKGTIIVPFISENYEFFKFIDRTPGSAICQKKLLGVFGNLGLAAVGNGREVAVIDAESSHAGGFYVLVSFKELKLLVDKIISRS